MDENNLLKNESNLKKNIFKRMSKKVTFDLTKNKTYTTYSHKEYDRYQIDSTLYQYNYNKISQIEWIKIQLELNKYKTKEMPVHIDSIHNTKI